MISGCEERRQGSTEKINTAIENEGMYPRYIFSHKVGQQARFHQSPLSCKNKSIVAIKVQLVVRAGTQEIGLDSKELRGCPSLSSREHAPQHFLVPNTPNTHAGFRL